MYYLRTRPAVNAIQFTVNKQTLNEADSKKLEEAIEKDGMTAICPDKQKLANSENILHQEIHEQPECCSS
jgi:hypothetical protein